MKNYLFVHFKEKTTPDAEQVYFGLSKDGFHWEEVNDGTPVLWAYFGTKGVRDHTIVRNQLNGKFYIISTDLSISYGVRQYRREFWEKVSRGGSQCLAIWESEDLVNWKEQRLIDFSGNDFGCLWAPDVIFDKKSEEFILHWSSCTSADDYKDKCIYYSRTKDFVTFSKPEILYKKDDGEVIDSAMYEENGYYYLFVKSHGNPNCQILLKSENITGPFRRVEAFDEAMKKIEEGKYEASTAMQLEDGRWCLFLDYYGKPGAEQGYVPFVAPSLESGDFVRSDADFEFPYGFKHGTILTITEEEYERIKNHDWSDKGYINVF